MIRQALQICIAGALAAGGGSAAVYAVSVNPAGGSALWLAMAAGLLVAAVVLGTRHCAEIGQAAALLAEARAETDSIRGRIGRDPLTGYLDRSAFKDILSGLAGSGGEEGLILIVFFDLNRFKEVNDTLGHDVGDQLLTEVAHRASSQIDSPWAMARLGGDEFAALIPWRDERQAVEIGESLVRELSKPYRLGDQYVEVGTSVGIAIGDPAIHGGDELLRRADIAMYEAKSTGDSAYRLFDDMLANRQHRKSIIRREIEHSDFSTRFKLHYQPIVNARTGKRERAEALLRTNSESLTGVSPALMVSVAEDSGQIVALTDWTIDTALEAQKQLQMPIAVNLSPIYFRHGDFAERLIDKLVDADADPSALMIEITEGVLISDIDRARTSIDTLREVGLQVYLDDFGTGYSSLSYLQHFELDGLKLDRSFLTKLNTRKQANLILRAMVDFGHSLEMKVVVEGVESDWQARMLQLMGCDYLQGYEVGLPMPLEELLELEGRGSQETAGRFFHI